MPTSVVCGVIENNKNEILIAQRKWPKSGIHYWEFPGGKVETGETLFQALIREWQEELEMNIRPINLITTIHHTVYDLNFIAGKTSDHPLALNNHLQFKWISKSAILTECLKADFEMLDTNKQFISTFF